MKSHKREKRYKSFSYLWSISIQRIIECNWRLPQKIVAFWSNTHFSILYLLIEQSCLSLSGKSVEHMNKHLFKNLTSYLFMSIPALDTTTLNITWNWTRLQFLCFTFSLYLFVDNFLLLEVMREDSIQFLKLDSTLSFKKLEMIFFYLQSAL